MSDRPSLTLQRHIKAAPASVFRAWTEPTQMMRWWGPSGAASVAETDPRVGGRFRVVFRTEDSEEHEVSGTYREVLPGERLVFTWAWRSTPERESLVSLRFETEGGGTLLTLRHERFFDEAARDGHHVGWTKSLGRLERLFA